MGADVIRIIAGLNKIAAKDYGLLTRTRAVEAGLKRNVIDRLLASGQWTIVFPTVYALGPVNESRHAKLRAALLWYGEGGVLSHSTAAELYQLDGIPQFQMIHLLRKGLGKRRRNEAMRCHGTTFLPAGDVTTHRGFRVTGVLRTLVDLASLSEVSLHQLELATLSAIRRKRITALQLVDRITAEAQREPAGIERLRALLEREALTLKIESELEARVLQMLIDERLRPPESQLDLVDFAGFIGRFDFVYRKHRVLLEVDGRSVHEATRQLLRDREKTLRAEAVGYRVLRARHEHLSGPHRRAFLADLRAALHDGARRPQGNWPFSELRAPASENARRISR